MGRRTHYRAQMEPPTLQTGFAFTLRLSRGDSGWFLLVAPEYLDRTPDAIAGVFRFLRRQLEAGVSQP